MAEGNMSIRKLGYVELSGDVGSALYVLLDDINEENCVKKLSLCLSILDKVSPVLRKEIELNEYPLETVGLKRVYNILCDCKWEMTKFRRRKHMESM